MTFAEYVNCIDKMIKDYTKQLPRETLLLIEQSIEDAEANCGKLWLEDYIDQEYNK
tara:strand:- start:81 stop:248 length:168 start_codon:yes stop_codon:yes gene_type:complete